MRKLAVLVLGYTVTDLGVGIYLRRGALERSDLIQLGYGNRVLDPIKELLGGNDPN